jgi:peptide/nickel transport system substrate-binding protein
MEEKMRSRFFGLITIVILLSMVLAACQPAATVAPAVVAPTATAPAPAVPTDTQAPMAQPTDTAVPPPATAVPQPTATPAPRLGGWLDQVVFTGIAACPDAVAQLQAAAVDMYPVTCSDANVLSTVKGDKNLAYNNVYGSNDQLILNPVDYTAQGILNPFSDIKIREAMNWAVDRNYVSQEIAGGLAVPKFTALDTAFPDAARNAGLLGAIATKYAYNLDKAQSVVNDEMTKLTATKDSSGKWQYKGKPVTIIGLIRTEDNRKQVGEYFANQLEKLGFTVDRQEKVRKEAAPIWQGDVKTKYTFGFYTAGWINTAIIRDEGLLFAEFNSGEVQNIPVFLEFKPSDELKTTEDALLNNTFKTMDERAQLFKTALDDSMTESWWGVWVIDNLAYEPFSTKVSAASDLAAGFGNVVFPYTVRFAGQEGGSLKIAQSGVLVQAWNPVQGSNWTDDQIVESFTEDHGTIPNPYTGLMIPKLVTKMDVVAKTGLPIAKTLDWISLNFQDNIAVPDDAWADWDATNQVFISAKDRGAAAAKDPKGPDGKYTQTANVQMTVTFSPDIFKTKWHDGSTLSMGDFIMGMIMTFDPGKKGSKIYDEGYATSSLAVFMTHFKGVKIVSTDPLTITTWDDKFNLDAENTIYNWYPSYGGNGDGDAYGYGTAAWHNLTPSIQAEADGKMAYSLDKSSSLKVDETSLVSGPTLAIESTYLDQDASSSYIPYAATMSKFVTADEAKTRYANLQAFYKAHNNMWLGTGPYFVDKVDSTAGSITLTRFADYPYRADMFSGFSAPEIAVASVDGPTQVKIGDDAPFTVAVTFNNQPYPSKDLDKVSYTLFASDGTVAASGDATMSAEGQYTIDITADVTGKLPEGPASLNVAVSSKTVSMPTFVTYQFVVTK